MIILKDTVEIQAYPEQIIGFFLNFQENFYAWHPELTPFLIRVEPDEKYQAKLVECLLLLLREVKRIQSQVSKMRHELVSIGTMKSEVRFDDE